MPLYAVRAVVEVRLLMQEQAELVVPEVLGVGAVVEAAQELALLKAEQAVKADAWFTHGN